MFAQTQFLGPCPKKQKGFKNGMQGSSGREIWSIWILATSSIRLRYSKRSKRNFKRMACSVCLPQNTGYMCQKTKKKTEIKLRKRNKNGKWKQNDQSWGVWNQAKTCKTLYVCFRVVLSGAGFCPSTVVWFPGSRWSNSSIYTRFYRWSCRYYCS